MGSGEKENGRLGTAAPFRVGAAVRRTLRVLVAGMVVFTGLGLLAGTRVYGQMKDAGQHFGDELLHLNEGDLAGDAPGSYYRLRINDQPVMISSGVSRHPPGWVLDHFEKECKAHADGLVDAFQDMDEALNADSSAPSRGSAGVGTLRSQRGDRGFVACVATGRDVTRKELIERVAAAAASGDLGRLGDLRYVTVEPTAAGGTHAVAAWTKGRLSVGDMFPARGDAPGQDLPTAPRPSGSRRMLTAFAEGTAYGVNLYDVPASPQAARRDVDERLRSAGWLEMNFPDGISEHGAAYARGGSDLLVTFVPGETHERTAVAYLHSRMRVAAAR